LLDHNAGHWEGSVIRLHVQETDGLPQALRALPARLNHLASKPWLNPGE